MLNKKIVLVIGTLLTTTTLTTTTALANFVTSDKIITASDFNIKLGAYASFESAFCDQNNLQSSENKISINKEGLALYNDTAFYVNISNNSNDLEYGTKIILLPTAKRKSTPTYNGLHLFIKNKFGRIELGSPVPVAKNMMISDGSIPTKYIKISTTHLKQDTQQAPSFLTSEGCFLGDDLCANLSVAPYSNEAPRTINYYTPNFVLNNTSKIQIGVSYSLDSANTGAGKPSDKSDATKKKMFSEEGFDRFEIDRSVKDVITTGVSLEQEFQKNVQLKLALTGEYGTSVGKAKKYISTEDKNPKEYKLANLRSFNIGGELKVNDFTYSVCYGSLGKSLTTSEFHKSGRNSHYYSVGGAYKYNTITTKASYFASEQFKNKVSSIKLNISHLLAPSFKPYVEVSSYTLKGKPEFYTELKHKITKGTVALLGFKLVL